jgi:hypothetical protein
MKKCLLWWFNRKQTCTSGHRSEHSMNFFQIVNLSMLYCCLDFNNRESWKLLRQEKLLSASCYCILLRISEVCPWRNGLETQEYGHGDLLRWPHDTLYMQKLAPTLPTSGSRLVSIVCSRTKAMELCLCSWRKLENWYLPVHSFS